MRQGLRHLPRRKNDCAGSWRKKSGLCMHFMTMERWWLLFPAVTGELGCDKMNIGIVEENKVLRKWYEAFGFMHTGTQKFDFFPFTCGYMEKKLQKNSENSAKK